MNLNAPAQPRSGNMDVDEFMAFLETRPDKEHWELIEGVAVLMSPVTLAHRRIAYNLSKVLNDAVEARKLDVFASTLPSVYRACAISSPSPMSWSCRELPAASFIRNASSWWQRYSHRRTRARRSI